MLFHELSEKGKRGETHVSGDFLDSEVGVAKLALNGAHGVLVDVEEWRMPAFGTYDVREIFWRHVHHPCHLRHATNGPRAVSRIRFHNSFTTRGSA